MSEFENSRRRRVSSADDGMDAPVHQAPHASPQNRSVPQPTPTPAATPRSTHSDSRKHPPRERRSKWLIPLLIIIILLLLFISACSAIIVAVYNNGNMNNLINLITGNVTPAPTAAVEYVYVTPEPTSPVTPAPTQTPAPTPTPVSYTFEDILAMQDSFIKKEFLPFGTIQLDLGFFAKKIDFQLATLTDMETQMSYKALRMECSHEDAIGSLSPLEIDSAIETLKQIKDTYGWMRNYTEMVYTSSNGLQIGSYHTDFEHKLFIRFNSNVVVYADISMINDFISLFTEAKTALLSDNYTGSPIMLGVMATPTPTPTPRP